MAVIPAGSKRRLSGSDRGRYSLPMLHARSRSARQEALAEIAVPPDRGYDPHAAPDPTPLWNILDWTPGDRGTDWYPKLDYGADA